LAHSIEQLRALPMVTGRGAVVALRDVAGVFVREGPEMYRSEDACSQAGCTSIAA